VKLNPYLPSSPPTKTDTPPSLSKKLTASPSLSKYLQNAHLLHLQASKRIFLIEILKKKKTCFFAIKYILAYHFNAF